MPNLKVKDISVVVIVIIQMMIAIFTKNYEYTLISIAMLLIMVETKYVYCMFIAPIILSILGFSQMSFITMLLFVFLARRVYDLANVKRNMFNHKLISYDHATYEMLNYYSVFFMVISVFYILIDFLVSGVPIGIVFSVPFLLMRLSSAALWTGIMMVTQLYVESIYFVSLAMILRIVFLAFTLFMAGELLSASLINFAGPVLCIVIAGLVWDKLLKNK